MSILSDKTIQDNLQQLFGYNQPLISNIQPCSVGLRLDRTLLKNEEPITIPPEGYQLQPGEFILGSTYEDVTIPDNLCAQIEGRKGVTCHITAGYIDAGFHGNITLEIYNCDDKPFTLHYGKKVCRIIFHQLDQPCQKPL